MHEVQAETLRNLFRKNPNKSLNTTPVDTPHSAKKQIQVNAIQHIALNCRDIKAQEQFYTKHFGFRRSRVFNADTADEFIMLRLESTCLELFSAKDNGNDHMGKEQLVGFKHLAFEVPDLEKSIAKLQSDGIQTDEIIDCASAVEGLRICFFNDPDGNRLELMQGYQDQFHE
jgi:glyoxylase I family protein